MALQAGSMLRQSHIERPRYGPLTASLTIPSRNAFAEELLLPESFPLLSRLVGWSGSSVTDLLLRFRCEAHAAFEAVQEMSPLSLWAGTGTKSPFHGAQHRVVGVD